MRYLWLACCLILLSLSVPAHADEMKRARELGAEGLALYNEGAWTAAYEKLAEANSMHSAPTLLLYMARCQRNRHKLVEAKTLYAKLAGQKLPEDAPQQFAKAHGDAGRELDALELRIPSLIVVVRGQGAEQATVMANGQKLADPGKPSPLNPGSYEIIVSAPGKAEVNKSAELREGAGNMVVQVELKADPGAAVEADDTTAPDEADSGGSGLLIPAIAAFAVGAAGLAVGIATGVMASSKADDIKSRCSADNHCLTTDAELGDEAETLATVSTIGFVVAGVGVAVGVVLLVVPTGDDDESVALSVAPNGLSLSGTF